MSYISQQNQIEIAGDIREISLLYFLKTNSSLISAINNILNNDSFLDEPQGVSEALSLIPLIVPVINQNMNIINILKRQSLIIVNGIKDILYELSENSVDIN